MVGLCVVTCVSSFECVDGYGCKCVCGRRLRGVFFYDDCIFLYDGVFRDVIFWSLFFVVLVGEGGLLGLSVGFYRMFCIGCEGGFVGGSIGGW